MCSPSHRTTISHPSRQCRDNRRHTLSGVKSRRRRLRKRPITMFLKHAGNARLSLSDERYAQPVRRGRAGHDYRQMPKVRRVVRSPPPTRRRAATDHHHPVVDGFRLRRRLSRVWNREQRSACFSKLRVALVVPLRLACDDDPVASASPAAAPNLLLMLGSAATGRSQETL